eukprot:7564926-Pyramimonas_sp.AAC.1
MRTTAAQSARRRATLMVTSGSESVRHSLMRTSVEDGRSPLQQPPGTSHECTDCSCGHLNSLSNAHAYLPEYNI